MLGSAGPPPVGSISHASVLSVGAPPTHILPFHPRTPLQQHPAPRPPTPHTGFMSNRGRQNVASFLALDLGLDWRLGGDWFEHLLVDYDVTANWGNWWAAVP